MANKAKTNVGKTAAAETKNETFRIVTAWLYRFVSYCLFPFCMICSFLPVCNRLHLDRRLETKAWIRLCSNKLGQCYWIKIGIRVKSCRLCLAFVSIHIHTTVPFARASHTHNRGWIRALGGVYTRSIILITVFTWFLHWQLHRSHSVW